MREVVKQYANTEMINARKRLNQTIKFEDYSSTFAKSRYKLSTLVKNKRFIKSV